MFLTIVKNIVKITFHQAPQFCGIDDSLQQGGTVYELHADR